MAFNADDYIEVKDRIVSFYKDHPEGRVQTEIVELTDKRVTVKALVYQNTDDTCPTTGHSWLNIPGTTNFTRGSELENAETSAVGRALALSGYEVKKSIASRDEVEMKQDDGSAGGQPPPSLPATRTPLSPSPVATPAQINMISARLKAADVTDDEYLNFLFEQMKITSPEQLQKSQVDAVLKWIETQR